MSVLLCRLCRGPLYIACTYNVFTVQPATDHATRTGANGNRQCTFTAPIAPSRGSCLLRANTVQAAAPQDIRGSWITSHVPDQQLTCQFTQAQLYLGNNQQGPRDTHINSCSSQIHRKMTSICSVLLLVQLFLLSHPAPSAAFTPEAVSQISNLASNAISSGSFVDLTPYGMANWAINSNLYAWLQQALVEVFNMNDSTLTSLLGSSSSNLATTAKVAAVAGGLAGGAAGAWKAAEVSTAAAAAAAMGPLGAPPMLPPLPPKHPLAPWATAHDLVRHILCSGSMTELP